MYNLVAVLGGTQLSTTPLQVVGAGQPLIPIIQMEDAPPNSPPDPAPLIEGSPFVLIFEGFQPGMVNVFVNSPAGQLIGTTTSTSTSTFTAPFVWPAVEGAHNVYAQDSDATQPPATFPVSGGPAAT